MLWTELDDGRVSALDPLGADGVLSKVPAWNRSADVVSLSGALKELCSQSSLSGRTFDEVLAIVRDLGIIAGSLRKHGKEPTQVVPELETVFVRAAALTDLVPRDTLMHYTIWNPRNERLRRYTDHPQEADLVLSIQKSLPAIREAARYLFEMRDYPLHQKRTLRLAYQIARSLKDFVCGLHHAMRHVDPEVFIVEFRPFFEPFYVGSRQYRGPGAVTMPLHIFDFLLWGSSEQDERFQCFTEDYVPYNAGEFRQYYLRARNRPSLIDRVESEFKRTKTPLVYAPLIAQLSIFVRRVSSFRNAHLKYAMQAYHGAIHHSFSSGSGGHTTGDLHWLTLITQKHAGRLEKMKLKMLSPERASANQLQISA